jgi:tetratricopeptide (TPR) repeat protein
MRISFRLLIVSLLLIPVISFASGNSTILESINKELANAKTPKEKSTYHLYRARYYQKTKEAEKALADYQQALLLNHQSFIHLERAALLMRLEQYQLALNDAVAAKEENTTLSARADRIINQAGTALQERHDRENPQEIVLDREINLDRKSRFAVARELGAETIEQSKHTQWRATQAVRRAKDAQGSGSGRS